MKKVLISILLCFLITIGCLSAEAAGTGEKVRQILLLYNAVLVLREDGRVVPIHLETMEDSFYNEYGCSEETLEAVKEWEDIEELAECAHLIAGRKADGTVVSVPMDEYSACYFGATDAWTNIAKLESGYRFIAGIRENGTVAAAGEDPPDYSEEISFIDDLADWTDIVALRIGACAAGEYAAGLRADGTVVYEGIYDVGWSGPADHVTDIDCSGWMLVAVREDGRVVANGEDSSEMSKIIHEWKDVRQAVCGDTEAIALRRDGTIVATSGQREDLTKLTGIERIEMTMYGSFAAYGEDGSVFIQSYGNQELVKETGKWTDIEQVYVYSPSGENGFILGLRNDGSVLSAGLDFARLYRAALRT